jgi:hypothetical protein
MKKNKIKDKFLEELKKVPIVQVACEKCNISRNSVYRWKNSDTEFQKQMEEALAEGESLINDLTEHQLLTLIKEKNWPAISFWLKHRNPKFKERVEVTTVNSTDDKLSPAQQAKVEMALKFVSFNKTNSK